MKLDSIRSLRQELIKPIKNETRSFPYIIRLLKTVIITSTSYKSYKYDKTKLRTRNCAIVFSF